MGPTMTHPVMSVFSPPQPYLSVEAGLTGDATAVRLARTLVMECFHHWGGSDELVESGVMIASELVTNAIKARGSSVRVRIRYAPPFGYVEVWDGDLQEPRKQDLDGLPEGGRGLILVEAYSKRWGFYHPSAGGKVVWAEMR